MKMKLLKKPSVKKAKIDFEGLHLATYSKIMNSDYYADIQNSKKVYQVDVDEQTITSIDYNVIKRSYRNIHKNILPVHIEYNPYSETFELDEKHGLSVLNAYMPPLWKREPYFKGDYSLLADENTSCPQIYLDFYNHLFNNDEESVNWVLNWQALCLKEKTPVMLCLVGSNRGTGKSLLSQIFSDVVGRNNSTSVKQAFLSKEFNSVIRYKQFACLEEVQIKTAQEFSAIKLYTNTDIPMEGKGVDAETVRISTNFMLLNNEHDSLKGVEASSDRQFSIPMLTNTPLTASDFVKVYPIGELLNPANIERFARFLWNCKYDRVSARTPLKTEHYHQIISSSAPEWHHVLTEDLYPMMQGKLFLASDLSNQISRRSSVRPGRDTVKCFCHQNSQLFFYFEKKADRATKRYILLRSTHLQDSEWRNEMAKVKKMNNEDLARLLEKPQHSEVR